MSKRRHVPIMVAWAALLAVAAAVFWDRLFPDANPAPLPSTGTPPAEMEMSPRPARVQQALRAKNPDYNGRGRFQAAGGKITIADLSGTGIVDPSPLRKLPLEALDLSENPIADVTSLRGMGLKHLALEATRVTDLGPLNGMKLTRLYLNRIRVSDLTPLRGMPLELLNLYETDVEDLTPLQDMPLKYLWLNGTRVRDISALRKCPLISLTLAGTPVTDLSPLAKSNTLQRLHIGDSAVTDLTPLKGLQLRRLVFTPGRITKGLDAARNMRSIKEIGTTPETLMPPDRFWGVHDQGKLP